MNKRILALLLAGIMTTSMAACTASGGKDASTTIGGGGTEPPQSNQTSATTVDQTPVINFIDVNETVYTTADGVRLLTAIDATTGAVTVNKVTELKRVKYSTTWSVVEYNGTQYYVATQSLTSDDIFGKGFTACEPTTMYATAKLKIRTYASVDDSYSTHVTTIEMNETVTVIAVGSTGGMDWSKIRYTPAGGEEKEYFVSSKYLSKTLVQDPANTDYSQYFEGCEETIMYVIASDALTLRLYPVTADIDGNWLGTVSNGDAVTVIARGTGDYEGWVQLKVPEKREDPANPQFYFYPYVGSAYLASTPGGEEVTLDDLIEAYEGFTKIEKTLYVSNEAEGGLNVRSAPSFSGDNIIGSFEAKSALKIVGQGTSQDGVFCYIVEFVKSEKTVFGFVSAKYVTPASDGTPSTTLETLLSKYAGFTKLAESKAYVASAATNCSMALGSDWATAKTIAANAEVTVVAQGTYQGAALYVVEIEGIYYFASADNLTPKTVG